MTYALSWAVQEAVYGALSADAALSAMIGDRLYDAPPPFEADAAPDAPWVTLGDERVRDWSTRDSAGAEHLLSVTVNAPRRGFADAKKIAARICDVLLENNWALSRGRVAFVGFLGGRTKRLEKDLLRQVELRFRVLVED